MKSILVQLDTDPQPSVFDRVVAVDAGVDQLFSYGGATPETVESLVHGAIFTRGVPDLSRTAIFVGGSDVACDGVFVYVGLTPNTGFVNGLLALGPGGHIPVDGDLRSQAPGLFAAGCVRLGSAGQAASSAGDGAAAAIAADAYLTSGDWRL